MTLPRGGGVAVGSEVPDAWGGALTTQVAAGRPRRVWSTAVAAGTVPGSP